MNREGAERGGGVGELDFSSVQVPTCSKYGVGSSFNKKQLFIWLDSLLWPSTRTATADKPNLKFWADTWTELRSNFPPYCEHVPSRTTQSCLLLRKEEIRPNIWPEIPSDLSLWRRTPWQKLSKSLDISSVIAQVPPDLLKILAILSNTTIRISAVYQEDLEPYWKSGKMSQLTRWSTNLLFTSFLNTWLASEWRLPGQ